MTSRRLYDEEPEINDFLQGVIDDMCRNDTLPVYNGETRKDGLPTVFISRRMHSDSYTTGFVFCDRSDGAEITVTQKRGW